MYRRNDPRLRRTINQLTQNLETANEQAQEGLYTFQQRYINPCLSSITVAVKQCAEPCFGTEEDRRRRQRGRSRGRLEHSFDFYDDWDEEENDLLGWGNDELEHLLTDSNGTQQPGRQGPMNYGTRIDGKPRRKSAVLPHEGGPDPTVLPKSSYFGFLDRWKLGGKGLRYKPSAADLQEHPGPLKNDGANQALLEDSGEEAGQASGRRHRRDRSHTSMSGHTTDSLSSRGDLFPSEDEADDAVPLDDEFAISLERRTTSHDESSSGRTRSDKSPRRSRFSTRTASSKSTRDGVKQIANDNPGAQETNGVPSLQDLHAEEARTAREEEAAVEKKRSAAQRLALERGLSSPSSESKPESPRATSPTPPVTQFSSKSPSVSSVVPFPTFDPNRTPNQITPVEEGEDPIIEMDKRDSAVASAESEQQTDAADNLAPKALPRSPDPD